MSAIGRLQRLALVVLLLSLPLPSAAITINEVIGRNEATGFRLLPRSRSRQSWPHAAALHTR